MSNIDSTAQAQTKDAQAAEQRTHANRIAIEAPLQAEAVKQQPGVSDFGVLNNIWRWTAKDKSGNLVQSAPGMTSFTSRGPMSKVDLIRSAQIVLNGMMQLQFEKDGKPDNWNSPELRVDESSIEALGFTEQTQENVGMWRPPTAKTVVVAKPDLSAPLK